MITMTVEQNPMSKDHELVDDLPENAEVINLNTIEERIQKSFKLGMMAFLALLFWYVGFQGD